jgi:hypothetical protein
MQVGRSVHTRAPAAPCNDGAAIKGKCAGRKAHDPDTRGATPGRGSLRKPHRCREIIKQSGTQTAWRSWCGGEGWGASHFGPRLGFSLPL